MPHFLKFGLFKENKKTKDEIIFKGRFVVQEHDATNLHWDFRLEYKGKLLSWAIPKNPETVNDNKLLAIRTEDHEMKWLTFSGEIPKGEYGAGTVKILDNGSYELLKMSDKSYKFILYGKILNGSFSLFEFKPEKWIFQKSK